MLKMILFCCIKLFNVCDGIEFTAKGVQLRIVIVEFNYAGYHKSRAIYKITNNF